MITTPTRDDIRAFAAAVRTHLDDLPADEVDDLLDGLEADLSDQATEAGESFTLPNAATYAAELRAAAGLPERSAVEKSHRSPVDALRGFWRREVAQFRSTAVGGWTLDLLGSLRPVWWVLRAFVLFLFLIPFLGGGITRTGLDMLDRAFSVLYFPGLIVFPVLLLLSIQWGRGRWAPTTWSRVIRRTVNVLAALLVVPFLAALLAATQAATSVNSSAVPQDYVPQPGLTLDGERLRNIYAYDAEGQPIPLVQLFDQNGNALTTVGSDGRGVDVDPYFYSGGGPAPVAYSVPGAPASWNVFPLREISPDNRTWDGTDDTDKARTPGFPFAKVQPLPDLQAAGPAVDATPSPEASGTASAEPEPAETVAP